MPYINEIEEMEKKLRNLKNKQNELERNCNHIWGETKSDPEPYKEPIFSHFEGHGSDPEPVFDYVTRYKDRWKRECTRCGKVEYTYTKVATEYKPKF